MEKIFFVMPAYNEEANIESVVKQWHLVVDTLCQQSVDASLVIANDGSKDNTFKKMMELKRVYSHFNPLNKANSGHGATLMYLYNYALENGADYVSQTDSDGQTNPEEFWEMWNHRAEYALQVGHRNAREDGFSRIVVTTVLKLVVGLTFGVGVTDANTPFRLMKIADMKPIIDIIPNDFFLSNVAMSAIAVKRKKATRWIPITFRPRQGGVNSINLKRIFKIGLKSLKDLRMINKTAV